MKLVIILSFIIGIAILLRRKQMGRPRKTESDTNVPVEEVFEQTVESEESVPVVVMNELALGFTKDKSTGLWNLVKIPYNFELGIAGTPRIEGEGEIKSIVIERFKIAAARDLLADD